MKIANIFLPNIRSTTDDQSSSIKVVVIYRVFTCSSFYYNASAYSKQIKAKGKTNSILYAILLFSFNIYTYGLKVNFGCAGMPYCNNNVNVKQKTSSPTSIVGKLKKHFKLYQRPTCKVLLSSQSVLSGILAQTDIAFRRRKSILYINVYIYIYIYIDQ